MALSDVKCRNTLPRHRGIPIFGVTAQTPTNQWNRKSYSWRSIKSRSERIEWNACNRIARSSFPGGSTVSRSANTAQQNHAPARFLALRQA